jgi:hypothetical protein
MLPLSLFPGLFAFPPFGVSDWNAHRAEPPEAAGCLGNPSARAGNAIPFYLNSGFLQPGQGLGAGPIPDASASDAESPGAQKIRIRHRFVLLFTIYPLQLS